MTTDRRMRIVGVVLGAALGFTAAFPVAAEEQGFTPIPVIKGVKSLEAGKPAPVFTVKDTDGKVFDFAAERAGRAHVLVFWSIFCEPCREEMPVIEKLANEYRSGGKVEILTVNMDGEPFLDGIKGFLRQYKYSFRPPRPTRRQGRDLRHRRPLPGRGDAGALSRGRAGQGGGEPSRTGGRSRPQGDDHGMLGAQ